MLVKQCDRFLSYTVDPNPRAGVHSAIAVDDAGVVTIVYHQAESFETLQAFLDLPELQSAMKNAGVTSEPEITFSTGGWGKFYD